MTKQTKLHFTRPVDRSIESFKIWIYGMAKRLTPNAKMVMTDQQWKEYNAKFWDRIDQARKKREAE